MKLKKKKRNGVTLIELLFVLAIIMILYSMVSVRLKKITYRKAKIKIMNEMSDFLHKNTNYYSKFNKNYFITLDLNKNELRLLDTDTTNKTVEEQIFKLPTIFEYKLKRKGIPDNGDKEKTYEINKEKGEIFNAPKKSTNLNEVIDDGAKLTSGEKGKFYIEIKEKSTQKIICNIYFYYNKYKNKLEYKYY